MKRFVLVVGCVLIAGPRVRAEDTVYFMDPATKKETTLKGTIDKEDPTGIKLKTKGGVKDIPALDITQIVYDNKIVDAISFREPFKNEANALKPTAKPAVRAELLKAALLGIQDLDGKLSGVPTSTATCNTRSRN